MGHVVIDTFIAYMGQRSGAGLSTGAFLCAVCMFSQNLCLILSRFKSGPNKSTSSFRHVADVFLAQNVNLYRLFIDNHVRWLYRVKGSLVSTEARVPTCPCEQCRRSIVTRTKNHFILMLTFNNYFEVRVVLSLDPVPGNTNHEVWIHPPDCIAV